MGGRSSKRSDPSGATRHKNEAVPVVKKTLRKAGNKAQARRDSDSSLEDEDLNLISVPLDATVSDKRLHKAKELIKSGRPISITLEATTEDPSKGKTSEQDWDEESRTKWKEQLGLMRHFYDWDEIPMDFFIDTYVGGGGEALRKRRLSLNIASEPPPSPPTLPANKPQNLVQRQQALVAQQQQRQQQNQQEQKSAASDPMASVLAVATAPVTSSARSRAVSMDSHLLSPKAAAKPAPVNIMAIPEGNEPEMSPRTEAAALVRAAAPTPRPAATTPKGATPNAPISTAPVVSPPKAATARRPRAASVAIGEAFPLPVAAAIQHQTHGAPAKVNKQVAQTVEFEARPRAHSRTSLEEVYGRASRQTVNFAMDNPLIHAQPQSPTRQYSQQQKVEKRPEQFKNMTTVIDPTQFATERRNTRMSISRQPQQPQSPTVEKPLFDGGRVSTASTMIGSNSSSQTTDAFLSASRSRELSEWL